MLKRSLKQGFLKLGLGLGGFGVFAAGAVTGEAVGTVAALIGVGLMISAMMV